MSSDAATCPTLAARDRQLALLVVGGVRPSQIARILRLNPSSVWRRMQRPEVRQLIQVLGQRAQEQACAQFAEVTSLAVHRIEHTLAVGRPAEALRAAELVLDHAPVPRPAPRQRQGTGLAREPSDEAHWPIRQALDQCQAEAGPADLHQWAMQHAQAVAQGHVQQPQAEEPGQVQDVPQAGEPEPQPPRRLTVLELLDQVAPWPD